MQATAKTTNAKPMDQKPKNIEQSKPMVNIQTPDLTAENSISTMSSTPALKNDDSTPGATV